MSETQSPPTSAVQEAYPEFVRKLYNRTGDLSKDFAHAILGIVTEIHEFLTATDEVNALEELGDLFFYVEALNQVLGDFDESFGDTDVNFVGLVDAAATSMVDRSSAVGLKRVIDQECKKLLDHAKRWVGYGKSPASVNQLFAEVNALIGAVRVFSGEDFDEIRVLEANMKKLLKRYPGGEFSAFHAVVRDLEAERAVLEAAQ